MYRENKTTRSALQQATTVVKSASETRTDVGRAATSASISPPPSVRETYAKARGHRSAVEQAREEGDGQGWSECSREGTQCVLGEGRGCN
ncbi:hypothetical protein HPB47_023600 [Ixodes persulcatus]|uniref:Uncharacterized protein n=1 Tax=Ixodes persulcatus TaxID=34615 RepID=A0AC60Q6I4_IXOPE|nr:hypothetical protein HPB47_023600 [Ixodes persulcatus]